MPLDPQSFEVLHILVQNSGKVVRRSDLLEAAWDAHVEDGALAYQIYRLREALGDDPGSPTYIETLRGRGFRFKAPVERVAVNRSETLSEADRLYLKGRYLWHKSTAETVRKAIAYFERALEKDPAYILAYTGIADAWVLLGTFGHQSVSALEAMPKAEAAAKQ
ncbi:MAG TPA: winged helix-turn-helix domain-containing protein, partial [Pyrinomonadaceae bacterium]|nr:winged helix-turn-helix domain-containing protein [Pyrinomonadaceae bacterium]